MPSTVHWTMTMSDSLGLQSFNVTNMNSSPANDTCLDQKDDDVSCLPRPKSSSWAPQLQCHTWWSRLVILTSYQMLKWSTGTERIHSWSYFSGEVFLRKRQVGTSFLIMDWGFCVDIMSSMLFGSERRNAIFIQKNPYLKIDKKFPKGPFYDDLQGGA